MNINLKTTFFLTALITSLSSEVLASESLSYSGRLVNSNGSPVNGPVDLKFDFIYTNATSAILCNQQITSVALTNGVFHVKLDPDCTPSSSNWLSVLSAIPAGEALAIRVTDETHTKTYSFQALHSMPLSTLSQVSKQLARLGATPGQVLAWDGSKWAPTNESGTGNGSVTSVATGTGLTGGPITTTGTISIANGGVNTAQLADGAVTDQKITSGVARNKLATGAASHVLVNDGSGSISSVAQLPVLQGGTGAANAAGARANLGLGTAAVVDLGTGIGKAMPSDGVPVCFAFEKLQMTAGPAFAWACVPDNDSADNTKLPLDGSVAMTGALDMDNHLIMDVATPTAAGHAANKAYVDAQIGGVTSSQWLTNTTKIYYNDGNVGVGTTDPSSKLHIVGNSRLDGRLEVGLSNGSTAASTYGLHVGLDSGSSLAMFGDVQGSNGGVTITRPSDNGQIGIFDTWGAEKIRFSTLADSYFNAGNVGIGNTAPVEKLDVTGNIALTGKVRMKSDNANFVEIQAPTGLATTLNFTLPATAGAAGNALVTNGAGVLSWSTVATGSSTVGGDLTGTIDNAQIGAGAITNTEVAAGAAIAQSKIANLTTDLAAKEPVITAGAAGQYYAYDKTWKALNTAAVAETTNLYFTEPRVLGTDLAGFSSGAGAITAADTVLSAFGKLDGNINALSTATTTNFVNVTGDTMSGPLAMGNQSITGLATPTANNHAATKAYVDSVAATGASKWTTNANGIHYAPATPYVGIGKILPTEALDIQTNAASFKRIANTNTNASGGSGISFFAGTNSLSIGTWGQSAGGMTTFVESNSANGLKINTYTNTAISFHTNTSGGTNERMKIANDGKVGIGTTTPTQKLHVHNTTDSTVALTTSSTSYSSQIEFSRGTTKTWLGPTPASFDIWSEENTPFIFGINNAERMRIEANGNVGIGTTTPVYPLSVYRPSTGTTVNYESGSAGSVVQTRYAGLTAGSVSRVWGSGINITNGNAGYEIYDFTAGTARMFINTSGNIGIGTVTPGYKLDVQGGNVNSSGAYTNTSDIRLKEEIKPLQNSLEKVVQLKPVSYYWKDRSFDNSLQIGLIAQEVEKVYPEVVKTDKKGMKTMSYPQLVSPIVDAIKELYSKWTIDHERIAKLEKENKALRVQNEAILKRLDKLEQSRLPASK